MTVPSSSAIEEEMMKIKEGEVGGKAKRRKCPGVRVVGCRIYDSQNGKTCHQCRQKTMDFSAACKNHKQKKQCTIKFCHKCLLNRYGEKAEEVELLDDWNCPKCKGICNCSFCMKKRGHKPTGMLVHTAKATGFSSVSEMLKVKGPENIGLVIDIGVSSKKPAASKDFVAASPRKPGKENSFDGNCHSSLNSQNLTPICNKKKSKKTKRKGLKELLNSIRDDDAPLRKGSPKRPKTSEEISTKGVGTPKFKKCTKELQNIEFHADIQLPQGTCLTTIAGIELLHEEVGDALQFLEFCAAFGEVANSNMLLLAEAAAAIY